jgi:hypothetical protein
MGYSLTQTSSKITRLDTPDPRLGLWDFKMERVAVVRYTLAVMVVGLPLRSCSHRSYTIYFPFDIHCDFRQNR